MDTSPGPDRPTTASVLRLAEGVESLGARLAQVKEDGEARDKAIDEDSRKRDQRNRALIAAVAVLAVALAGMGFWVSSLSSNANTARAQAATASARADALAAVQRAQHNAQVSGCEQGNTYRAGTVASLDQLVTLLVGPHPAAAVQKEATAYEAYVLAHNEPRNCQTAYPAPKAVPTNGAS